MAYQPTMTAKQRRDYEATLAYIYLSGRKPKKQHHGTPVYWNVQAATDFEVNPFIRYFVKPEFIAVARMHAMTAAHVWAEAQGWKIEEGQWLRYRNRTLKNGFYLIRYDEEGRKEEATLYPDGSIRWYVRAGKWVSGWKETFIFRNGEPLS